MDPYIVLPKAYKEFLKVFSYEKTNKLLLHRPRVDHTIHMQPGTQPPAGPLYGISRNELQVFKKYLKKNLSKEFIWVSLSLAAALVLFIKILEVAYDFVWTTIASMLTPSQTSTYCHWLKKPWTSYAMQYISPNLILLQLSTKSAWQLERNGKPHSKLV